MNKNNYKINITDIICCNIYKNETNTLLLKSKREEFIIMHTWNAAFLVNLKFHAFKSENLIRQFSFLSQLILSTFKVVQEFTSILIMIYRNKK